MSDLVFHWHEKNGADIASYKTEEFTYTYQGKTSAKAFWVFDLDSEYRPGSGIMKSSVLLVFDFGPQTREVIRNVENHVDFETADFMGETGHPWQIIVKSNEGGAYGIGAKVRAFLIPKSIRLATKTETAKALGKSEKDVLTQSW